MGTVLCAHSVDHKLINQRWITWWQVALAYNGHIPANRWQMAVSRMGKHPFSMDLDCLFLHSKTWTWAAQDYCSHMVSVSQIWQTCGWFQLILVNVHLCAHKYIKRQPELLWIPSSQSDYLLLLLNVIVPINTTFVTAVVFRHILIHNFIHWSATTIKLLRTVGKKHWSSHNSKIFYWGMVDPGYHPPKPSAQIPRSSTPSMDLAHPDYIGPWREQCLYSHTTKTTQEQPEDHDEELKCPSGLKMPQIQIWLSSIEYT